MYWNLYVCTCKKWWWSPSDSFKSIINYRVTALCLLSIKCRVTALCWILFHMFIGIKEIKWVLSQYWFLRFWWNFIGRYQNRVHAILVLTRGLIWHLNQSSIWPSIYFMYYSWNQPVLRNKGKVSCSRKQWGPLMGLEPRTSTLRVRRPTLPHYLLTIHL